MNITFALIFRLVGLQGTSNRLSCLVFFVQWWCGVLLSMTGYGAAQLIREQMTVQVEVRAVNNRHLKLSVRGTEPYPLLEAEIEKVVRRHVRRGSLLIQIRVHRLSAAATYQLNEAVLRTYLTQLVRLQEEQLIPAEASSLYSGLLALPGVAGEQLAAVSPAAEEWPLVESTLEQAILALNQTRQVEGQSMADELLKLKAQLVDDLAAIEIALPAVMHDYRDRLLERIQTAIAQVGVTLKPEDLIRELALYADRTDVSEEVVRLKNHLVQYDEIISQSTEGAGRRLEFIVQEIGREVNTTGSKAGSAAITRRVVEMKATLEKIRELIQNVE